jgi:hypothetical protein
MPVLQVGLNSYKLKDMPQDKLAEWLEQHKSADSQLRLEMEAEVYGEDENPFPDWLIMVINDTSNTIEPHKCGRIVRFLWSIGLWSNHAEYDYENRVYMIRCTDDEQVRKLSDVMNSKAATLINGFLLEERQEYDKWAKNNGVLLSCKLLGDEEQLNQEIDELYGARGKGGRPNMGEE